MGRRDRKKESNIAVVVGVALFAAAAVVVLVYSTTGNPVAIAPPAAYEPNVEAYVATGVTPDDGHLTGNMHTPGTLLVARKNRVPELEAWAKTWEAAQAGGAELVVTNDETAAQLRAMVDKSDLTAMECFHIAKLIGDKNDLPASEAWMNPGVARAEIEIGDKAHDDKSVNPLLNAMGDATPPLWQRGTENGQLLERMSALSMKFDRSAPWSQRPEWSRIGYAEALYLQERYEESLTAINAFIADIDTPAGKYIKDAQKIEARWGRSLALIGLKRHAEAVADLKIVVEVPAFHHIDDALPALVNALCSINEPDEAEKYFNRFRRDCKPKTDKLLTLMLRIATSRQERLTRPITL